jgi:hypothetical protein
MTFLANQHLRILEVCQLLNLIVERETEMSKGRDRIVFHRKDGTWANKRNDSDKASSLHDTQSDAEKTAREMLRNQGGRELIIKGLNGKIRDKDTIPPGNDPYPPKG